ncbi:MAG TPA: hypothetical protein DDY18_07210, partial [Flavobacterium sp.]|nr:hypothetical protein [Flavobacterium sp.]
MLTTVKKDDHPALNLLFIISLVFVLYILKPIVVPIIIAIILSVSVFPFVLYLERKWHFNRVASAIFAILLLSLLVSGLITFIGFQISDIMDKGGDYADKLSEVYNSLATKIETTLGMNKSDLSLKKLNLGETLKENSSSILDFVT